ncbi:MAG: glycosyltransferase [Dermatophilaceae bacterium]
MRNVPVEPLPLQRLVDILPPDQGRHLLEEAERARTEFGDRVIWHVNATAQGGGVAEMLQTLLAYGRGAGIENRWLVLDGEAHFFAITKRIHNLLHGEPGDGGPLGEAEHEVFERVLADNLTTLRTVVRPGDIVMLHDPQTAGLVPGLQDLDVHVVWRCHVGRDVPNECTELAWGFLHPYLRDCESFVFSLPEYAPDWVPKERLVVIAPSIDPFTAKNADLDPGTVEAVLAQVSLVSGADPDGDVEFTRRDGSAGTLWRHTGLLEGDSEPPPLDARLIVQVSRWDRLKDMVGVMDGFVRLAQTGRHGDTHLVLAGPATAGVSDDPEGAEVLEECRMRWQGLHPDLQRRVHLVSIPMEDVDANALIVNALQRHAYVVVQKSLVEGFGLTVTEAMWKGRPVIASKVGGIRSQIVHERDGLLIEDPHDPGELAGALDRVLSDPELAARLGENARARVLADFLGGRHLEQYVDLFAALVRQD